MSKLKFFDEARVFIESGKGGNGSSSFRREKFVPFGGPDGGNGGDGGDVILKGHSSLDTLVHLHHRKHFRGESGENGKGANRIGKKGADSIIEVPCGTEVYSDDWSLKICEILEHGQEFTLARGGKGGIGNAAFKTSTNKAPEKTKPGEDGQSGYVKFRLKIVADVGLVGMPNAGKSTLISKITNAKPKIADYEFTTLSPVLGSIRTLHQIINVVDIPGLIEGASENKGMGTRFLKHLERCNLIIHVIDGSSPNLENDYNMILNEIEEFNPEILDKTRILFINKTESVKNKKVLDSFIDKIKSDLLFVKGSCETEEGLDKIKQYIIDIFDSKLLNKV